MMELVVYDCVRHSIELAKNNHACIRMAIMGYGLILSHAEKSPDKRVRVCVRSSARACICA